MARVMPVTEVILDDEPCILLYEANGPSADSQSVRRYRHLWVIRDDAPAEFVEDMGLACEFGEEMLILGGDPDKGIHGLVETVARLIDYADDLKRFPFEKDAIPRTDLIGGYYDVMEQRQRVLNGERP